MSTYREKTIVETDPIGVDPRLPVNSDVVVVRRPISNGVIAALVVTGIVVAALITYLIVNNQQRKQETDLALQQSSQAQSNATDAQARANQQQLQPTSQQPVIVNVPSTPQQVAVPVPTPAPSSPSSDTSSSNASVANLNVETDVNLKFADDKELVGYALNVKASNGVVTLTGAVPTVALKTKAADVAMSVKGVSRVVNNLSVQ